MINYVSFRDVNEIVVFRTTQGEERDPMTRNVRSATTVIAIIAVALAAAGCAESTGSGGATSSGSASGDIKIGAVLDITGAGASLGVPERQTLEMLAAQVNSGGGVNGRKINLLIEDDQSTEAARSEGGEQAPVDRQRRPPARRLPYRSQLGYATARGGGAEADDLPGRKPEDR